MLKKNKFPTYLQKIKVWKKDKKKIVVTNGCFDLLHPGHKYLFRKSKKKNHKLVVLINSDLSVKKLKGKNRPIQNEKIRKKKVDLSKFVNLSIIFREKTPLKLIKKIKPDYIVKGADYKNKKISGSGYIKNYGGKIKIIELYKKYSTTNIIKNKL